MLLRHATLRRNLPSIDQRGLLCAKSLGRMKVVWLHAPGKTAWALLHTVRPGDVVLTGTPSGVGYRREPKVLLRDGDRVVVEVERVGRLENPVAAE